MSLASGTFLPDKAEGLEIAVGTMNAAQILFNKLSLDYVHSEMLGKQFENSYLECKEKADPHKWTPDQQDESNFAKALAGFANTSGGVLIFGLKAREQDDVDEIKEIVPIAEVRKFESRLRELESRIVERPVADVDYRSIETSEDEGIVAVYVPQSNWLPHRSKKDWKFYIRAGGAFQSIDLNLVEDLFFRRRLRPRLELRIVPPDASHLPRLKVSLVNSGQATARNPYVVIELPEGISAGNYGLDGHTLLRSFVRLSQYQERRGSFLASGTNADLVVHPCSEVTLCGCSSTGNDGP